MYTGKRAFCGYSANTDTFDVYGESNAGVVEIEIQIQQKNRS